MPEAAPAGGSAPAPRIETVDGDPGNRLSPAELADSAAVHATEARTAARDAETALVFAREHADGIVAGAEQALADAEDAANAAEDKARQAAIAAGQEM